MKNVINHMRVPVEAGETDGEALERAKLQLKLSEKDLEKYQIHFIHLGEDRFNFKQVGKLK